MRMRGPLVSSSSRQLLPGHPSRGRYCHDGGTFRSYSVGRSPLHCALVRRPPPSGDRAGRELRFGRDLLDGFDSVSAAKPSAECLEATFEDGRAHVGQEPEIKGQVVQRQQAIDEELARREQVAQIGPGEEPTRLATALGVEG